MTSWETQQQETIMMARLSSLCLVFLSLQVRCSSTVETLSHYGVSGGNTTFSCIFLSSGRIKFFCRETCEGENLLIRTSDGAAQIGRYRTEYVREASRTFSVLSVSISELTRSDAGRYRCGLGDSSSSASFQDFRLVVVDDLLGGSKVPHLHTEAGSSVTVACSFGDSGRNRLFCRGECGKDEVLVQTDGVRADRGRYSIEYEKRRQSAVLLVTITQLTQSDSGRYRCKMDRMIRSDLHRDFYITVTDAVGPSSSTPTTTIPSSSSSAVGPSSSTPAVSSQTLSSISAHVFTNNPTSSTATTQRFNSSSRNFTHEGSFKISNDSAQIQDNKEKSFLYVPVVVGVTLAAMVVLIPAALLVSCRRRSLRDAENEGGAAGSNAAKSIYENSTFENPIYQDLSYVTKEENHIYCTIEKDK
ncbi:polymeric immunoglobulin receptor-like isoform X2 [Xiphophorus couchianus]|uniref:polymeric immunoglobulin receptor-like isoform X2 n=1 Tax=Xiphophorus couchianus TaxID=32473 RepID=UPI0010163A6F|nr:polymeric immunoglobulin receptor-like isoform X2 [Xiphophorus couchianus]